MVWPKLLIRSAIWAWLSLAAVHAFAQDPQQEADESSSLEEFAEKTNAEPEDDSHLLDLDFAKRHPIDLNEAGEEELSALHLLTDHQIADFLAYRKLLGRLLNIYELQAVPDWELMTIRKILPYVRVGQVASPYSMLRDGRKDGNASLLLRTSQVLERSVGYNKPVNPESSRYLGSPQKIFFRYNYNYRQLLEYGLLGEKDAGEPFFRKAQRWGFDFYSFHFFIRNSGIVKALALGDFTVNLGQGLIQWQTFSFMGNGGLLNIRKQGPALKPYRSPGESDFHRGAGITLQKKNWSSTLFISLQRVDGNSAVDTATGADIFTSFQNSGYHRTPAEIGDRYSTSQFSFGGNAGYSAGSFSASVNFTHFRFSRPFQRTIAPYTLYSFRGREQDNFSFSYDKAFRNLHLFGEYAFDRHLHRAMIQGALLSLGERLDLALLYRNISPAYQSLYADAFTQNASPSNEKGLYSGISLKPWSDVKLEMYYDLFEFPWIRYEMDGPGTGNEWSVRFLYEPDKKWLLRSSFSRLRKPENESFAGLPYHRVFSPVKTEWQAETDYKISSTWRFRSKIACVWLQKDWDKSKTKQEGFLGILDIFYRTHIINTNLRIQRFLTPGYDFRIYIYENDMLFDFSVPPYYDTGWKYAVNIHKDFLLVYRDRGRKGFKLSGWIYLSQLIYDHKQFIGSGLDEITGNRKSELKLQLQFSW
ncbi:MAG TPA: hypothetical protein VG890_01190 [Puia sp.]|nr:hypothetical protein [Puia sp.]